MANEVEHSDLVCGLHVPRRQLTHETDEQDRGDDPEQAGDHDESDLVVQLLGNPRVGVTVEPCDRGGGAETDGRSDHAQQRHREPDVHDLPDGTLLPRRVAGRRARIAALPELSPHEVGEDAEGAASQDVDGDRDTGRERLLGAADGPKVLGHPKAPDDLDDQRRKADDARQGGGPEIWSRLVGELAAADLALTEVDRAVAQSELHQKGYGAGDDADDVEGDERLAEATDSCRRRIVGAGAAVGDVPGRRRHRRRWGWGRWWRRR